MNTLNNLNGNFEYELLDKNQRDSELSEKLNLLYASPFAGILWWELRDNSLINDGYYKLYYYEQKVLKHIILFRFSTKSKKKILVINNRFKILSKDIENICHILFKEFDKLQQIFFEKLFTTPEQRPKMIFEKDMNDIVISLPESFEDYVNSFGKKHRQNNKSMTNRIARDLPDFKVNCFEKNDILYEQIEKLGSIKIDTLNSLGIKSKIDYNDFKISYQYATSGFGLLCLCTIDDKIIGGVLNFIIGESAYGDFHAYDKSYEKYSIGRIAILHSIKCLIEKKVKHFHVLGGTEKYKFEYGGVSHDRYSVWIFRNNNVVYFLEKIKVAFRGYKKKIKDQVYYQRLKNTIVYNFIIKMKKNKMRILGD